jgi:stage II sporulation protein D
MNRILIIGALVIAGWGIAQQAEPKNVRVRLFSVEQPSRILLTTGNGQTLFLDARENTTSFRSGGPVTIERGSGDAVRLKYPVEVSARNGTLVIITELPLNDYVAAVLAGESLSFRSEESLKAMAVAARTYAVHFLNRHGAEGFDFCDTTHCQDFRVTAVTDRLRNATGSTTNEVLRYQGQPIPAYYHQNCGGVTEPRAPYLRQMNDSFCTSRALSRWSTELMVSELQSVLRLSDVYGIEVTERTSSGRARRLRISASETRVMEAEAFRLAIGRTLGWNKIPSDLYDVRRSGDRFVFDGRGAGHGIGLCQDGAAAMGEQGRNYKEILAYYYPNTSIASIVR